MSGHTAKRPIAHGTRMPNGRIGIVCYFDQDTFAELRELAVKAGSSFGEQVRLMVEWGLEEDREYRGQR